MNRRQTSRNLLTATLLGVFTLLAAPAFAKKGHEHKEVFWEGNCKVERKFKKNGEYKEKRKCNPAEYYAAPQVMQPVQPVLVEPGISIQGHANVRIP